MKCRFAESAFFASVAAARVPFRFGAATLRRAAILVARARIESADGGRSSFGFAADLLVPKWFEKDPAKSARDDAAALAASAREAAGAFAAAGTGSAFDLWTRAFGERVGSAAPGAPDRLVRGFGVALVERAVVDAACRAAGVSFFDALSRGLLGFDATGLLPERPAETIEVRHTVGLLDALRAGDLDPAARVADGFPETLEDEIRTRGVRRFKVKLDGTRPGAAVARLLDVAAVARDLLGSGFGVTADGNESFPGFEPLEEVLFKLDESEAGRFLLDRLLFVEQPLPRAATFVPVPRPLRERVDLVIDEADDSTDAFSRAVDAGYRGVSVKNCKGVFRALQNRSRCEKSGGRLFQTAEDLTNLPVLALQQDLATVAALGLPDAERNGHHYFRGLEHLPRVEAADALSRHAGLYEAKGPGGAPALRIAGGRLDVRSLRCAGYGYDLRIRVEERMPLDAFTFPAED